MKTINLELVCKFLEEYHHDFQDFLESKEIEPTEADPIIDDLKEEIRENKEHCP